MITLVICHSSGPVGRGRMNILGAFTGLLLVGLISSAPVSDETLVVTSEFFPDSLSIYSSQHDIVNLFCPLNSLNFDEDSELEDLDGNNIYIFFVEADVTDDVIDYKGLYVLKNKKATKLLDNGRDFDSSADDSKKVYLAATDGIYVFNPEENKAEKFGTITDNLVSIALSNASDFLYVLTEDRILYKVTEEGTKKEEITDVKDATQIVLDDSDNLYFLDTKKHVYMKTTDGIVKKVKGVPTNPTYAKLIKPPFAFDEGVVFVGGKKVFGLYSNGTSEYENIVLKARPTAISVEATLLQYYAYNKKIYEYNILSLILGALDIEELKKYFSDKEEEIKKLSTKSRKTFNDRR